jgi:glycosyltransferase involved in cell wall biosynthesis
MKVLFIVPYPTEGPSNRFRVEQYLPFLEKEGIEYTLRPFFTSEIFKVLYKKRYLLKIVIYILIFTAKRIYDIFTAARYDIIFIHREAYPFGGAVFEYLFKLFGKKLIFDYDDSIFLPNHSSFHEITRFLKKPSKIKKIIKMSDHIIAGNQFLKDYAKRYNKKVTVLPTCIDTDKYKPLRNPLKKEKIVIGWIGSHTTQKYLLSMADVFSNLLKKYKNLEIRIIGGQFEQRHNQRIICKDWSIDSELKEIQEFNIGIMPLDDDDWARGKCAFKIIQYMSVGTPAVASRVGMNIEVIEDGVNGFLINSKEEWIKKLSLLIDNRNLRLELGKTGRATAEERYSVQANYRKFINTLKNTLNKE